MRTFAAARFLVGCGGSGAMALGLCSITDMFKPGKRRVAFAIMMIVYSLASSLSPIVGVHINRRWGPSWIFSGTASKCT
jgi:MFS family permease